MIEPDNLSLNEILVRLGYRTETVIDDKTGLRGKKIISIATDEVAHQGSADSTWKWLRQTGQVK